jgi:hypothetical protein
MRVLLISPPFPETYGALKPTPKLERKRFLHPSLGLLMVSALLPRDWKRCLVDCEVDELDATDINWADMVFVAGVLMQKEAVQRIVAMCKAQGKIVTVVGSTSIDYKNITAP